MAKNKKQAYEAQLQQISVIAELERIGWDYHFASDEELKVVCPAHEDESPSAAINIDNRMFKCHAAGCGAKGDFVTFLAHALKTTRRVVFEDLKNRYNLRAESTIDPQVVEQYHNAIWNAKPMLKELYDRGLSDATIRKYRIGFHAGRIIIPVADSTGLFVNLRRYLPGAPGKEKMRNSRGKGKLRLYPIEQLKYERIVICGGEVKALAVAQRLNERGIGAVTAAGGEGNWHADFTPLFKDKQVWVCLDVDPAGAEASERIAAPVKTQAKWAGIVALPLDTEKYPHGDVNDYFGLEEASADDFYRLLEETEEWFPKAIGPELDDSDPQDLHLSESTEAKYSGKKIKVKGIISAIDNTPYLVPKTVTCICDRNQPLCHICPVYAQPPGEDKYVELTLNMQSPAIIEMVNAGKATQQDALREGLRIPVCKSVTFKTSSHYNVEDIHITPQLEISSTKAEQMMLPALAVAHGLEGNAGYDFTGRTYPHPRSQQAILLVSDAKPADDALSLYNPSDDDLEPLKRFQPKVWSVEGLQEKLNDLYGDLEANVTRIFKRRDLHLAVDLAYHSVLLFDFDGRLEKGWTEVLVVGDSAQGKSETTRQLMKHYDLGEKVECKNASRAGLLGGLQQIGNRWYVMWGVIPTHDKRLVVLEELKGASTELIGSLTDMRSSGIAEIPKIEKRRTHARTRLVALSNPRSDMPLSSYNYGVDAIRELIGSPEDIRRFDMCMVVAATQIDATELNKLSSHRPDVRHVHTRDLCKQVVLWAWSRSPQQVSFDEAASEGILEQTNKLCNRYADVLPIVDRGSMRLKLARLAVGLAARTFSHTDSDRQTLLVRSCHVDYVAEWLDGLYSDPAMGYADFSRAYKTANTIQDPDGLRRRILATPFPRDVIEQLLHTDEIELRDVCDWCGWERGEATELLSFFVRKHAFKRVQRHYRKTPQFIELLKRILASKDLEICDRPDHISEEDF